MDYKGEGYEKLTLFKGIPYDEVKSILEKGSLQKLKEGEVLLRPGQTNTRLFLLLEGGLGIHFTDLVSEAYVEIMPGACIGELSVFYDKKTTAYGKANRNSKLLVIDHNTAWELVFSSKQFITNLLKIYSQRMRYNTQSMAESLFVNTVPDIIYRLDKNGNFLFLNKTVEKLGYKVDELLGKHFSVLLSTEDKRKVSYESVMERIKEGNHEKHPPKLFNEHRSQERKTVGLELSLKVKNSQAKIPVEIGDSKSFPSFIGDISCTGINIPDPNDQSYSYAGTIGIIRDITERKKSEQIIYRQAHYDALTDLPNRALFMATLREAIQKSQQKGTPMALIFIDLDRFKWVNDNLGHGAGDQLLREVARRLNDCVSNGTVARLGGDEFTIIMPEITCLKDISLLSRNVLESLNQKFLLDGQEVSISGSMGISLFPDDAKDFEELLKCADKAMYRSKEAGRNAYHFFNGESFIRKKNYE